MEMKNGYILVRVDEEVTKLDSGLFIQSGATKLPNTGIIEAIAEGVEGLSVGDKVEFLRYASLDGIDKDTRLCTEEMIIAKHG